MIFIALITINRDLFIWISSYLSSIHVNLLVFKNSIKILAKFTSMLHESAESALKNVLNITHEFCYLADTVFRISSHSLKE